MATTFKILTAKDVVSTRNLLHEAVPITGAIVSGTYDDPPETTSNIKNFPHGLFQAVYDYPYLSSSANHIFDVTCGYSNSSALSSSSNVQNAKKINIYNEMAQVLVGFDENSVIRRFDADGDFISTTTKIDDAFFLNFTRLLTKDEVKKGSFTLQLGTADLVTDPMTGSVYLRDTGATNTFKVNSPVGEYGILYASNAVGSNLKASAGESVASVPAGLIYYQAGIAVITASLFSSMLSLSEDSTDANQFRYLDGGGTTTVTGSLTGSAISASCDGFRNRIYDMSFNNTTELNSTVYFCRANHNEFNYSSNPTYLSASQLVVKNQASDIPVSYVTTVGLYSPDNELLGVAKLSEPLKKDPTNEFTIRVRLDY